MSDKKIIAVVGATGAQGSGLVKAILEDPSGAFTPRAITRNPSSEKARELAAMGAEVVEADVADKASLEKAFEGAYGAYCVTFFWEHLSPEKEKVHAKNQAEAAKAAGVQHVVWSTLEDTRNFIPLDDDRMPTLQGKYKVPHFDAKGEADAYFEEAGVPTTYLATTFYWDNFVQFGMGPQRDEDGRLALNLPMGVKKLPSIAAEDIGPVAYGIFKKGSEFIGERVGIAGEHVSGAEMAEAMSRAFGEPVRYNAVPFDTYRSLGFPGADDLGNMFQFYHDFEAEFRASRPVDETRALNPGVKTFETWLEAHKDEIPID